MDLATIIGLLTSFGLVTWGILMGGSLILYWDMPSVVIVFGGTIGATLVNFPLSHVRELYSVCKKTFLHTPEDPTSTVLQFVDYANRARREGILALEPMIGASGDDYLRKGLQLAVDGMEPQTIRDILETEISKLEERHEHGAELLSAMGAFAPALGMIGTLIGLVAMLKSMNDPATIGPSMAVALLTTFYGATLANLLFLPMAGKLRTRSRQEVLLREMMLEGVLAISKGENPRMVEEKLSSFLAPRIRRVQA